MNIGTEKTTRKPINKPVLQSMKRSSIVLRERSGKVPRPGRSNRTGRGGRGKGDRTGKGRTEKGTRITNPYNLRKQTKEENTATEIGENKKVATQVKKRWKDGTT